MTAITQLHPGASPNSPHNAKLENAAHEFEAALMKEFIAPLEHDSLFSESSDGADSGGGSESTLMSFGSEAMAKAISEHGGFGIATRILDHFHATEKGKEKAARS
ncbi:hypothetical protein [Acidipila rosea]|uniref:Flagellar protein FlgJ n=1 Tax=Acidipila rosea TaxID=768535 RepID=A0A4R1LF60_9BACT|nr:hypothetical protein [Acidipila rosea]MBW4027591.1 hypothetical protein [Acidobacteriota bacterium]TCK75493.1 flagellar protein FlgJ [Acidipila rosea]